MVFHNAPRLQTKVVLSNIVALGRLLALVEAGRNPLNRVRPHVIDSGFGVCVTALRLTAKGPAPWVSSRR
jgi:hypothetical protein